jgi:electron transport complex protein RnfG
MLLRHMMITTALLTGFAVIGTSIVALTRQNTHEIIAENQRQELLRTLNELVPPALYDNDPAQDMIAVQSREYLGTKKDVTVYRARHGETPVAVIMTPVAPDGYSGDIGLLVAIDCGSGNLLGVRVLWHKETPGLGDWIETEKSDWIHSFTGHSLVDPDELGWRVEKDGGIFDQVTGATITPRAIVKAVYNTLKYYDRHQTELLSAARPPADASVPPGSDEPQRSGGTAAAEDQQHEPG